MAPQDIRRELLAVPFNPVRLYLSDGSHYDVRAPGHAYMELTRLTIGIDIDRETNLPRNSVYAAPNHVTRIEPLGPIKPPPEPRRARDEDGSN